MSSRRLKGNPSIEDIVEKSDFIAAPRTVFWFGKFVKFKRALGFPPKLSREADKQGTIAALFLTLRLLYYSYLDSQDRSCPRRRIQDKYTSRTKQNRFQLSARGEPCRRTCWQTCLQTSRWTCPSNRKNNTTHHPVDGNSNNFKDKTREKPWNQLRFN